MDWKTKFLQTMLHEEKLNKLLNKNIFIGLIFDHGKLWAQLAFISNLTINFVIIASYSDLAAREACTSIKTNVSNPLYHYPCDNTYNNTMFQTARKEEPRFWYNNHLEATKEAVMIIGIANIQFSALVVLFFLLKRAPLLVQDVWEGFWDMGVGIAKKSKLFLLVKQNKK